MKKSTRQHAGLSGSHPEDHYLPATRARMFLDRPTSHGGWPEGEYDPPVRDRIYGWYKKMKMMPEAEYLDEEEIRMRRSEARLRELIREHLLAEKVAVQSDRPLWSKALGLLVNFEKEINKLFSPKRLQGVLRLAIDKFAKSPGYVAPGCRDLSEFFKNHKSPDIRETFAGALLTLAGENVTPGRLWNDLTYDIVVGDQEKISQALISMNIADVVEAMKGACESPEKGIADSWDSYVRIMGTDGQNVYEQWLSYAYMTDADDNGFDAFKSWWKSQKKSGKLKKGDPAETIALIKAVTPRATPAGQV